MSVQVLDRVMTRVGGFGWWAALSARAKAQTMYSAHRGGMKVVSAAKPSVAPISGAAVLGLFASAASNPGLCCAGPGAEGLEPLQPDRSQPRQLGEVSQPPTSSTCLQQSCI